MDSQEELFHPLVTNYTYRDYNAGTSNWWVIEDDRGIIYIANREGILEYDGSNWRLIQSEDKEVARSFAKDNNGIIYAGFVGDLGYLAPDDSGTIKFKSLKSKLPDEYQVFREIWSTLYQGENVYYQTHQNLFRWTGAEMEVITPENNINGIRVVHDEIYAGIYDIGLCRLVGDRFELIPGGELMADRRIYNILPYGDGGLLVGTRDEGFFHFDGTGWQKFHTEIDQRIKTQLYLPSQALDDGRLLINTLNNGVYILNPQGQILQHINKDIGLQDNIVDYIYVDSNGILWMALFNGIATVNLNSQFTFIGENSGLPNNTVNDCIRHNGILYLGTVNGLYYYNESSAKFKLIPGTFGQVYEFLVHRGRLYSSTNKMGIFEVIENKIRYVRQNINGDFIVGMMRLSPEDSNRMFIDKRPGLASLYYNETLGTFQEEDATDKMRAIFPGFEVDGYGNVWTLGRAKGTVEQLIPKNSEGVFNLDDAEVRVHDEESGLPDKIKGILKINGEIDFLGDKIYGYDYEQDHFFEKQPFYSSLRKPSAQYFSFPKTDQKGRTWIQAGLGTAVLASDPSTSADYIYKPFTEIKDLPIWGIYPDQHLEDSSSIAWFTGPEGMVRYIESLEEAPRENFKVLIRNINIADNETVYGGKGPISDHLIIDNKKNTIDITYAAPFYIKENNITYETYLEGYDPGWSPATAKTSRKYNNLPAGDYIFKVRANNIYEEASPVSTFSFCIKPSVWHTWWMYLIYTLSFALTMLLLDKWRNAQLKERQDELQSTIDKRTQEIVDQKNKIERLYNYQTTLLSEVHHRIKNNLQLILSLLTLQKAKQGEATDTGMIDTLSNRINSISLIHEQLYNRKEFDKLNAQEYAKNLHNNFSSLILEQKVDVDLGISDIYFNLETITPLGLIWSELISNSLKYNAHVDGLKISIILKESDDRYHMHYSDNGMGYPNGKFSTNPTGMGYSIISTLSRQLIATTDTYNDNGAHFTMKFKEKNISPLGNTSN